MLKLNIHLFHPHLPYKCILKKVLKELRWNFQITIRGMVKFHTLFLLDT